MQVSTQTDAPPSKMVLLVGSAGGGGIGLLLLHSWWWWWWVVGVVFIRGGPPVRTLHPSKDLAPMRFFLPFATLTVKPKKKVFFFLSLSDFGAIFKRSSTKMDKKKELFLWWIPPRARVMMTATHFFLIFFFFEIKLWRNSSSFLRRKGDPPLTNRRATGVSFGGPVRLDDWITWFCFFFFFLFFNFYVGVIELYYFFQFPSRLFIFYSFAWRQLSPIWNNKKKWRRKLGQ